MFKKKYSATSQIVRAFQKAAAREKLAHVYVCTDKHSRAVKTYEEHEILKDKAWQLVFELYPVLKKYMVTYIWAKKEIVIKKEQ